MEETTLQLRDSSLVLESTSDALRRAQDQDFDGVPGAHERANRLRRALLDGELWQPLF